MYNISRSRPYGFTPSTTTVASQREFLVAVDFGTTYSAVAWLQTRAGAQTAREPTVIDEWPSKANTEQKVPTTLQYDDENEDPSRWGFQTELDPSESKYQWFKLELDPKLQNSLGRKYPKTTIPPRDVTHVEKLITDYLQQLRKHIESRIKASFAGNESLLRGITWAYIITVPAVWPEAAQNATRRYAEMAGMASMRPVQIITEPEAAGIYALENMSQEIELSVGDTFIICDAGGGTVDLISYTINAIKSPVTHLEESAPGNGALCGSTFLDMRFDDWIRRKFSGFYRWDDGYHADALARWESEIKRNFDGDTKKKYFIPARGLPDTPDLGIRGSKFEVSGRQVKELFEPVIAEILSLVKSQTSETEKRGKVAKAVLLAGGFGRNEYLKKRIQAAVGHDIRVERMKECTTAIVRGALIRGLAPRNPRLPNIVVESRIARKHYGTRVLTQYDPVKHSPSRPRIAGGVNGGERIEIMQWFVAKGSDLKESEPASFSYYFDESLMEVFQHGGQLDPLDLVIYTCEEDTQPNYPDYKRCHQLVKLTADFNQIPKQSLRKETGPKGEMYYKIPFQIEMTCQSASMTFALVHNGNRYGSVRAQYI